MRFFFLPIIVLLFSVALDSMSRRGRLTFTSLFGAFMLYGIVYHVVFEKQLPRPFTWLPTLQLGYEYWRSRSGLALLSQFGLAAFSFVIYLWATWHDRAPKRCISCGRRLTIHTRDFSVQDTCARCLRAIASELERRAHPSKLKIRCPKCGSHLKGATSEMTGDIGVCPACKAEFEIHDPAKEN